MATGRKRSSSWEFIVRREVLLPKPLYLTFASEQEGDQYVRKLEALLECGVVPDEFRRQHGGLVTIEDAGRKYLAAQHVPPSDKTQISADGPKILALMRREARVDGGTTSNR
jgi:hypothetical protein